MEWKERLEIVDNILAQKLAKQGKKHTFQNAADFYGTSTSTYGRWKRAEKIPDGDELQLIATKLNLSAEWLLLGIGAPERTLRKELSECDVHIADTLRDLLTDLEDPIDKVAITGNMYPQELELVVARAKKLPVEAVQKWIHAYKINANFLIAQIGQPFLTEEQYAEKGPLSWVRERRGDALYSDEEDDFQPVTKPENYEALKRENERLIKELEEEKAQRQSLTRTNEHLAELLSNHPPQKTTAPTRPAHGATPIPKAMSKNHTKGEFMRLKVIILVITLLFTGGLSEIFLTPSNAQAAELCTPAQKESAKKAQDMLQTFAKREEVGVSVYYEWFEPWYSLSYHQQLQIIRAGR